MKMLSDLNLEAALTAPSPLAREFAVTAAYRAHEHASPVAREIAVLQTQMATAFEPIEDDDLLAGRIRYPLVSFSPEPGGLGYACIADKIRLVIAERKLDATVRAEAKEMIAYWSTRTTAYKTRAAYPPTLAAILPSDAWTTDSAAAFPLYRMAGTVLDYEKLLRLGLPGLTAEITDRLARAKEPAEREFLEGLREALQLIGDALRHYAAQARGLAADCGDADRVAELNAIATACAAVAERAPETFHEAMQLAWIYALASGTWNYGRVDDWLGTFLVRDLDAGRLTDERALDLVCSWWSLIKSYENQFNNRVFIGGRGRTNEAAADRFALLAITATRRVRLNQPQLSLRFYDGQNPELMARALDAIGEGCTFPMLYNDDVNIPAVACAFGLPESEAVHYTPYGCGEYVLSHRSVGTPNGVVNLTKCLELALRDGHDPVTRRQAGPHTGALSTIKSFEDLWRAYTTQLQHYLDALADQEKIEYDLTGQDAPFLFLSALYDDCISRAKPIFAGGVRHLGGTVETYGNTNAADSLSAIQHTVFQDRAFTLPQLVTALDANFAGPEAEAVRQRLLAIPKYGNDDDAADAMAIRVHEHVCTHARAQAGRVGLDSNLVVVINNSANTILGHQTAASPDGRRFGEPLANGNNPAPGADRNGITAFLSSLAKLDPSLHAGAVQNMKFSASLFTRHRAKLEAMLAAYWASGGTQAMITVVSRTDLEAAMVEPEKWAHLLVRVGGFSIRFIDLPRDVQCEVLSRTLYE
ncbi:MAG: pyruvate formate lyase family protein [Akkermansiaceae bacterium]